MSEAHARLGPSNHRWPNCPGSVREEERYPDIAGEAAIDGTGSHLLLELALKEPSKSIFTYEGKVIGLGHEDSPHGWLVDKERITRVKMALDYVQRRINEMKNEYFDCDVLVEAESKADPGGAFGRTDWWGTCDITLTARHCMTRQVYFIEVIDYKDGRGYVSEKNNTQLISYLFGKMRRHIASGPDQVRPFNANRIGGCRMTILQPKTNPAVRYVCSTRIEDNVTVDGVIKEAERLAVAAHATDDPNASLNPGKHCQWCKANPKRNGHCTAAMEQSIETVNSMSTQLGTTSGSLFEQVSNALVDLKSLTEQQLSELADAEAAIQAVFDRVKDEIKERIEQGITVPGYAMEPGNGKNEWGADEETIAKKLKACRLKKDDIYPAKLISPAQMKKLPNLTEKQKDRLWDELVTYKGGAKTLKKVARPAIQSATNSVNSAEMMFGDVANKPVAEPAPVTNDVSFF